MDLRDRGAPRGERHGSRPGYLHDEGSGGRMVTSASATFDIV